MFRSLVVGLIGLYQKTLSPDHGPLRVFGGTCRFAPTCSEYTKQAVKRFGVVKGLALGAKRVGRCHPLTAGGYDPVPAVITKSSNHLIIKRNSNLNSQILTKPKADSRRLIAGSAR
ncbi:MAG: membrane protein insertion efficiency factor YidD [Patescibacteria group bacterium]